MDKAVFIELLVKRGALRFGQFQTKSGRQSPYFFNSGSLCTGQDLSVMASLYADLICRKFPQENLCLFGPAYKGIPLVAVVTEALFRQRGRNLPMTYNRKEVKDHGEGGHLVGHRFGKGDRVLIIEDVLTGGTSVRESVQILRESGAELAGVVVGIDRQEKGRGVQSAREEIEKDHGIEVHSLLTLDEIIDTLSQAACGTGTPWGPDQDSLFAIKEYRRRWGSAGNSVQS